MKKFLNYSVLFVFVLLFGFNVRAKELNHFYAKADDSITFKDEVNGSAMLAGESVDVDGYVNGINFSAGNKVKFNGQSDYMFLAGNSINVDGDVLKDVAIAGNIINIGNKANLQRDAVIAGSDIEIGGIIGRNVTIYGAKVSIKNASIYGNVRIFAQEIKVDDTSFIAGKLSYPEDANVSISSNVKNVVKTSPIQTDRGDDLANYLMSRVWSLMSLVLIFSLLSLLIPKLFENIQKRYEKVDFNRGVQTFTKGIVFLILVPVLCLMLLMIPFGIPLSLIIFALYIIIIYLSKLFAGYFVGYKLWQKFFNNSINMLVVGLFGITILFVLDLIPIVRYFVMAFSLLFGIGIIIESLIKNEKA